MQRSSSRLKFSTKKVTTVFAIAVAAVAVVVVVVVVVVVGVGVVVGRWIRNLPKIVQSIRNKAMFLRQGMRRKKKSLF